MEKKLNKTGVFQSQHHLLMDIASNPSSSQIELAKEMKVTTATIAVSLKKLEKNGYIARHTSDEDNRLNKVAITEKGMKVVEESRSIFRNMDELTFRGFSDSDMNTFISLVKRITDNIREEEDE